MGMELFVPGGSPVFTQFLERLLDAGMVATVVMVDGRLHPPTGTIPPHWEDVRLRLAEGMISLKRRPDGIAVVVFGNADATLTAAQRTIAEALRASQIASE